MRHFTEKKEFKVAISIILFCSILLSGCGGEAKTKDVPLTLRWSGDFPVAELTHLPKNQQQSPVGFISNADQFESVWNVFKPSEQVPVVDFRKNFVVFVRNTHFYNSTSIGKMTLTDGVLNVLAMETMSAMPIEDKVAMSMTVVPRSGVKGILVGNSVIPLTAAAK